MTSESANPDEALFGRARDDPSGINAQTRLVGVMGWPVAHSLSPAMHNAALQSLGLNWRYVPLPVRPGMVEDAIRGARALGFDGVNVTVPHKREVMKALDEITPGAAAVGAVNTVVIQRPEDGETRLVGHNTDVPGFIGSLRARGFEPARGGRAVVLGAGGAARAVIYALLTTGTAEVMVLNRTLARAEALVADLRALRIRDTRLLAVRLSDDALVAAAQGADLLVNATTVGMWPRVDDSVWPDGAALPRRLTVYDLVYNPLETRLLCQARRAGVRTIDGLGMLARQGALALSLWLGNALDVDRVAQQMRAVCERRLNERRDPGRETADTRAHSV